uniref:DUF834 domain-containing protein n=1 Tax=Oryza sativa subsp. japonica TaxID=39947 RepID=Q8S6W2_ORYSJ|nr:Hypothetical protein [Oryza sativa Japonica Group]
MADGNDDVSDDVITGDGSSGACSPANDGATTQTEDTNGAPAVFGGGEAVDGDGDDLAIPMVATATDDGGCNGGPARLNRRQRRRRLGLRGGSARRDGGLRQRRSDLEGDDGGAALGFERQPARGGRQA